MSILLFELTDTHVKLLKNLRWNLTTDKKFIIGTENQDEDPAPFGENNLYDAMDLILNGVPENFDPLNSEEIRQYSTEEKVEWDRLYSELPMALDIILFNGHFETGIYKTKFHDRQWKKQREK